AEQKKSFAIFLPIFPRLFSFCFAIFLLHSGLSIRTVIFSPRSGFSIRVVVPLRRLDSFIRLVVIYPRHRVAALANGNFFFFFSFPALTTSLRFFREGAAPL